MLKSLVFSLLLFLPFQGNSSPLKNLIQNPPAWMLKQIKQDLGIYKEKKLSIKKLNQLYQHKADEWLLVKFVIKDEGVYFKTKISKDHFVYHMFRTKLIGDPSAVKINFQEHKGFTWVTPEDGLKLELIKDEDACFKMVYNSR